MSIPPTVTKGSTSRVQGFVYPCWLNHAAMLRGYLVFMVVLGMFASMLGSGLSRSSSRGGDEASRRFEEAVGQEESSKDDSSAGSRTADGAVELERSGDGHFYADVRINGAPVHALIDTGASGIALSRDDARSAGLAVSVGMNDVIGKGADGDVRGEFVRLDKINLGHKSVTGMNAVVLNSGEQSLLGQDFLAKFDSVEIHGNTMVLR